MKKQFVVSLLLFSLNSFGQMPTEAQEIIDINNIKAIIKTDGSLFNDSLYDAGFEVPKGSNKNSIFSSSLWIGGLDANGQLHQAAKIYSYNDNKDYWPGPISTTNNYTAADSIWNRLWKISAQEINIHRWNWWQSGYTIPETILNWPAHGDVSKGQANNLAPFIDINQNGVYEPQQGDYPKIKGDEAVYFIFNDHREPHAESNGEKLEIEVHGMVYGFDCDSLALGSTLFLDYSIYNRSTIDYIETYVGLFVDFDIGYFGDDFSGCDVNRSSFFGYNADSIDDYINGLNTVYGTSPPAQSCTFLKGPTQDTDGIDNVFGIGSGESINGFGYSDGIIDNERLGMEHFTNFQGPTTLDDPFLAIDYYNLMKGYWLDGTQWTYGAFGYNNGADSIPTKYLFPGESDPYHFGTWGIDPNDTLPGGWSEDNVNSPQGDRRTISSSGPFTFEAGSVEEITMAFTFAKSDTGDQYSSVALMQQYIDDIRGMFLADTTPCGHGVFSGLENEIQKQVQHDITVYPNPTQKQLFVKHNFDNPTCEVYDIYGKLISTELLRNNTIDVSNLVRGVYLLRIENETIRFVKD